jgi:hypothetical protein
MHPAVTPCRLMNDMTNASRCFVRESSRMRLDGERFRRAIEIMQLKLTRHQNGNDI